MLTAEQIKEAEAMAAKVAADQRARDRFLGLIEGWNAGYAAGAAIAQQEPKKNQSAEV